MGQAVLSFPQFQDLEPDEAIKLFSDLVDFEDRMDLIRGMEKGLDKWTKFDQGIKDFGFNVTFLHIFLWARA